MASIVLTTVAESSPNDPNGLHLVIASTRQTANDQTSDLGTAASPEGLIKASEESERGE